MTNTPSQAGPGHSLLRRYVGTKCRVFLSSGTVLMGEIKEIDSYFMLIQDASTGKEAVVNIKDITSLSKIGE